MRPQRYGRVGRRTTPHAFTEHGAVMAASVLTSQGAIESGSDNCLATSIRNPTRRGRKGVGGGGLEPAGGGGSKLSRALYH